jgi:hypothetical protein
VVLHLLRLLPVLFGDHRHLALENLALRQQLAVSKRMMTRPRLRRTDRLFWDQRPRVESLTERTGLAPSPPLALA